MLCEEEWVFCTCVGCIPRKGFAGGRPIKKWCFFKHQSPIRESDILSSSALSSVPHGHNGCQSRPVSRSPSTNAPRTAHRAAQAELRFQEKHSSAEEAQQEARQLARQLEAKLGRATKELQEAHAQMHEHRRDAGQQIAALERQRQELEGVRQRLLGEYEGKCGELIASLHEAERALEEQQDQSAQQLRAAEVLGSGRPVARARGIAAFGKRLRWNRSEELEIERCSGFTHARLSKLA